MSINKEQINLQEIIMNEKIKMKNNSKNSITTSHNKRILNCMGMKEANLMIENVCTRNRIIY